MQLVKRAPVSHINLPPLPVCLCQTHTHSCQSCIVCCTRDTDLSCRLIPLDLIREWSGEIDCESTLLYNSLLASLFTCYSVLFHIHLDRYPHFSHLSFLGELVLQSQYEDFLLVK